jgi:hypothetical protein
MTIIPGRSRRPEAAARSRHRATTALALAVILAACGHSKAAAVDTTTALVVPTTAVTPSTAGPTTTATTTTATAPTTTAVAPTTTPAATTAAASAATEVVVMPEIPAGVAPTKDDAMAIAKAMLAEFNRRYDLAYADGNRAAIDALDNLLTARSANRAAADEFFGGIATRHEQVKVGPNGYIERFAVDELLGVDSLLIAVTECARNEGVRLAADGSVVNDSVNYERGRVVLLRDAGGPWLIDNYTSDEQAPGPDQPFENCKDVLP